MVKSVQLINCSNDEGNSESGNTSCFPPLGLISIASYLQKNKELLGLERIEVIDCDNYGSVETIKGKLNADLIGFSVLAANYKNSLMLAQLAKSRGKLVVFGNDYASHRAFTIMNNRNEVDFIIVGDAGEISIYDLIKSLNSNMPLSYANNLVWRDVDNKICMNNKSVTKLHGLPRVDVRVIPS